MAQQALDCPRGPSLTLFYQFSPQLYKLLIPAVGSGPRTCFPPPALELPGSLPRAPGEDLFCTVLLCILAISS